MRFDAEPFRGRPATRTPEENVSNIGSLSDMAELALKLSAARRRALRQPEIDEAKTVFLGTINYDQVVIADQRGLSNRPFTYFNHRDHKDEYILFLGPAMFAAVSVDWPTFIHELTHAWQGQNHLISAGYMLNSVIAQGIKGDSAYDYTVGSRWRNYNSEQQAHLVEDWYGQDGKSEGSPRFVYIRDCIRQPLLAWLQEMPGGH
jgi:hypothetical protein